MASKCNDARLSNGQSAWPRRIDELPVKEGEAIYV